MTEHTPKPCPFCGSDNVKGQYIRDGVKVSCLCCHAAGPPRFHGPKGSAGKNAVAAWNDRAAIAKAEPPQ